MFCLHCFIYKDTVCLHQYFFLLLTFSTGCRYVSLERDAFDTLFDHAPDKLNVVKKVICLHNLTLFFVCFVCAMVLKI